MFKSLAAMNAFEAVDLATLSHGFGAPVDGAAHRPVRLDKAADPVGIRCNCWRELLIGPSNNIGAFANLDADSGDCGQGFRLNTTMHSDRRRPPVPTKAAGVWLPA